VILCPQPEAPEDSMARRPNFLIFITDQHRADWLSCTGHPVLRTPNIDALAARGTVFGNCHTASPVCMPNRASLLTGRWPTQHGLRTNGCILPRRATTFVDVLRKAGYATAAIGKSHLQPFTGNPPIRPAPPEGRLIDEAWALEAGDYGQEEADRYAAPGRYAFPTPYYGYDHVEMVTEHGDRCGGHYQQWVRAQAPDWQALHDPANELPHNYACPQAYRTPVPEELYPTAFIRDRAADWLRGRAGEDDPFFLFVSFPDPHHPFNPPGRYWDMYDPDAFAQRLPYAAHRNPTPPMQWMAAERAAGRAPMTAQTAFMTGGREIAEAMALTAGMIAMVDDAVGAVMAALRETGQADDTVVCFTADHGDYLGDFDMLLKGALPFRAITRVPMIWADPEGTPGTRSGALASTVDLSATVLDRAGLVPFNGMMGRSLLPCLDGSDDLRETLLVEYNDGPARLGFERPARVRSLLTRDHRLTLYGGQGWGELYDLAQDPDETANLWDDPGAAAVKADLTLELAHTLTGLMDESPLAQRLA
jgi:arylsulfatase A-like enzyme